MGQIVGGAAKPKRCNLNKLSQLGTPAAGEHILVSSDNSMNAAGQGNFDCYIVGDRKTPAAELPLISISPDFKEWAGAKVSNEKRYGNHEMDYTSSLRYAPCIFQAPSNSKAILKKVIFNTTQLGADIDNAVSVGFGVYNADKTKNSNFSVTKNAGESYIDLTGHEVPAGGYLVFNKAEWGKCTAGGMSTLLEYYAYNATETANLRGAGNKYIFTNVEVVYEEETTQDDLSFADVVQNAENPEKEVVVTKFYGGSMIVVNSMHNAFAATATNTTSNARGTIIPVEIFDREKAIRLAPNDNAPVTSISFITNKDDFGYGKTIPFCEGTGLYDTTAWLPIPSDCQYVVITADNTTRAIPTIYQCDWDTIKNKQKHLRFAILGDSYSTFENWIPQGYLTQYPYEDVTKVQDTWFWQLCEMTGCSLLKNAAFGGATICTTGYNGADYSQKSLVYTAEQNLGQGNVLNDKPDIILIYAGTNDAWAGSPVGTAVRSGWTSTDLQSTIPAFDYIINYLQTWNPNARIIVMLNSWVYGGGEMETGIIAECEYWGVEYRKIDQIIMAADKHPHKLVMSLIAATVAGMIEFGK